MHWSRTLILSVLSAQAASAAWTVTVYDTTNTLFTSNWITALGADASSRVHMLAGYWLPPYWTFDGNAWQPSQTVDTSALAGAASMLAEPDGTVWIGVRGLYRIRGDSVWHYDTLNSCIAGNWAVPLGTDAVGRLVLSTAYYHGMGPYDIRLQRFNGNECAQIDMTVAGPSRTMATSYARDSTGLEWFGLGEIFDVGYSVGLFALASDTMQAVDPDVHVFALCAAGDTTYAGIFTYVGARTGVLVLHNGRVLGSIDTVGLLDVGIVREILYASDHSLWIGSDHGLIRILGPDTAIVDTQIGRQRITSMVEDPSGRIWVGTALAGIAVYEETQAVSPMRGGASPTHARGPDQAGHAYDLLGHVMGPPSPDGRRVRGVVLESGVNSGIARVHATIPSGRGR